MTALRLVVEPSDPTPPYEQLRRQLADLIETGRLGAGDRLPPVRQLAADLGLASGTVARTYRELESAGLLVTRRGGGTRVADVPAPVASWPRLRGLTAAYVDRAAALGCSAGDIEQAVREALRARSSPGATADATPPTPAAQWWPAPG